MHNRISRTPYYELIQLEISYSLHWIQSQNCHATSPRKAALTSVWSDGASCAVNKLCDGRLPAADANKMDDVLNPSWLP